MISQFNRSTLINIFTSVLSTIPTIHRHTRTGTLCCSLIVICHVHFVRCGRNSIFSFFTVFLSSRSSSFAFVVVPSNASLALALALAVLVLLKLLNSFFLFLSSLFLLLPSVRPLLFFSALNQCADTYFISSKKCLCVCFFSSLHSTCPVLFIAFVVISYFSRFVCVSSSSHKHHRLLLLLLFHFLSVVCVFFRIHLTECLLLPSIASNSFCLAAKKVFASFHFVISTERD